MWFTATVKPIPVRSTGTGAKVVALLPIASTSALPNAIK